MSLFSSNNKMSESDIEKAIIKIKSASVQAARELLAGDSFGNHIYSLRHIKGYIESAINTMIQCKMEIDIIEMRMKEDK